MGQVNICFVPNRTEGLERPFRALFNGDTHFLSAWWKFKTLKSDLERSNLHMRRLIHTELWENF